MTMLMRLHRRRGSGGGGGGGGNGPYGSNTMPSFWYSAKDFSALSFGDPITLWSDKSGNGYDLTTDVGTPTYQNNSQSGGCVRFANNMTLNNAVFNEFNSISALSWIVVSQWIVQDNSRVMITTPNSVATFGDVSAAFSNNYMGWRFGGGSQDNLAFLQFPGTGQAYLWEIYYDGSHSGNNFLTFTLLNDGVSLDGDPTFHPQFGGTLPATIGAEIAGLCVGGQQGGGASAHCDIMEIIGYASLLPTDDQATVRAGAMAAWNLP